MGLSPADGPEDKTIVFKGVAALFQSLDEMHDVDFVIVNSMSFVLFALIPSCADRVDVSQADFDRIDMQREILGRKFRFFFQAEKQQLHITVPKLPHERMHAELMRAVTSDMDRDPPMPLWALSAATTYKHPNGSSSNESDASGCPDSDGSGSDTSDGGVHWPALVIECALSQSLNNLHAAMRWWFSASGHRVQVVLCIKLHQSTRTAIIEKFTEEVIDARCPGATMTRSVSAAIQLHPVLQQTITIAPVPDSGPAQYRVMGGALVLKFTLLYRREPGPSPDERDVVISKARLERLARTVWR